jgi:hypothetical protein
MDVKTMCLDHNLHEEVCMAQQLGFYGLFTHLYQALKALKNLQIIKK